MVIQFFGTKQPIVVVRKLCVYYVCLSGICIFVKHCPKQVLLSRLNVFVLPILSYRWVRWPYTKSLAKRIDILQRKMICIILGVRKLPHESPDAFRRRRGKMAAQTQRKAGLWSNVWGVRQEGWALHVKRNTANASWVAKCSLFMTVHDLQWRRACFSGRPHVRQCSGYICTRWYEGLANRNPSFVF